MMSGFKFKREVSWDQKSGIEPLFWTTELICVGHPSGTSSNTICSVSTSFATLPFSFTPRFKYLCNRREIRKMRFMSESRSATKVGEKSFINNITGAI